MQGMVIYLLLQTKFGSVLVWFGLFCLVLQDSVAFAVLELALYTRLASDSQRSSYLYFSSVCVLPSLACGIKFTPRFQQLEMKNFYIPCCLRVRNQKSSSAVYFWNEIWDIRPTSSIMFLFNKIHSLTIYGLNPSSVCIHVCSSMCTRTYYYLLFMPWIMGICPPMKITIII